MGTDGPPDRRRRHAGDAGVADEIHIFEDMGLVEVTRGHLRDLDRARMENLAAAATADPSGDDERLMGEAERPSSHLHVVTG